MTLKKVENAKGRLPVTSRQGAKMEERVSGKGVGGGTGDTNVHEDGIGVEERRQGN